MSKSTKVFGSIIIILGLVIIWLIFREKFPQDKPVVEDNKPRTGETLPLQTAQSYISSYGFSFNYPEGYRLLEASPELLSIGRETTRGVDPLVQIVLVKSGPDTGLMPFEEFVIDAAREYCITKKANSSSLCTRIDDVVNIAPFVSKGGVPGQVFYLKYEETEFDSQKTTRGRRGPFYTFNTSPSTPNEMSFLMVYNPISITAEKANLPLIESVAESLVYKGR